MGLFDADPAVGGPCSPGETRSCSCAGGSEGIQSCEGITRQWARCDCEGADGDADGDVGADVDADDEGGLGNAVDLLFVIDNSTGMLEEQEILTRRFQGFIEDLIDRTLDEGGPVLDLHVGVVTTDLGTGGHEVGDCPRTLGGDEGELVHMPTEGPVCREEYRAPDCTRPEDDCPWIAHSMAHPEEARTIWLDFACLASVGTGGCRFAQPLEASRLALTELAGTDRPNEGFLRETSVVAVVFFSIRDDCSLESSQLLDPGEDGYGPMNVRCATNEGELRTVSEFTTELARLRPWGAAVIVAAFGGVPIDGSWMPGDRIEELRALVQVNPDDTSELVPSCETPLGLAYPPVRLAELVDGFGDNGILRSICSEDSIVSGLDAVARRIQALMSPAPRPGG